MSIKRKYVDSHWLIFAFEGAVALLFGWFALFSNYSDVCALTSIVGSMLLGLGIIELFNLLRRTHLNETWGVSLVAALVELGIAFALLFTADQADQTWHLALIAGYTVARGALEIVTGLKAIDDSTDKFIWTITGICGAIMGFVILGSGNEATFESNAPMYIKFFGAYLMLYGLSCLIYGVHNHDQANFLKDELRESAKKAASARKTSGRTAAKAALSKTTKKTTKTSRKTAKTTKKPAKKTTTRRK